MAKLTVLYGRPDDPEAFDDYYFNQHLPFAQKMPDVRQVELSKVVDPPYGTEPPYYRMAEMWYENMEQLRAALGSDDGRSVLDDLTNFAPPGTTLIVSESD